MLKLLGLFTLFGSGPASSGGESPVHKIQDHPCGFPDHDIETAEECFSAATKAAGKDASDRATITLETHESSSGPSCMFSSKYDSVIFADGTGGLSNAFHYVCEMAAHHLPNAYAPMLFMCMVLVISIFAQALSCVLPKFLCLPHTVFLFIFGFIAALAVGEMETKISYSLYTFQKVDPHIIFWALLPPLLFEDSAGQHWHVLLRVLPNCLLIAVPGVIINTVMTGSVIFYTYSEQPSALLDFPTCLMLGSILSATDPVAVVGTLHSLHAPDKLSALISGEALLNDGSAVVLFEIFFGVAKKTVEFTVGHALLEFLQLAGGGVLVGVAFAIFLHFSLQAFCHQFQMQMSLIIASFYLCYFISEDRSIHVSGVLSVVTLGFYMSAMGNFHIQGHDMHEYHAIIGFIAHVANESIFVLAGLVCYGYVVSREGSDWNPASEINILEALLLYVLIHISRGLTIFALWPFLRRAGYGLCVKEAVVLVFGGLRGAVGLALAMMVDLDISPNALSVGTSGRVGFHVSAITLLTLIVNGSLVGKMYRFLRVYKDASCHKMLLCRALESAEEEARKRIVDLERNWFFHNTYFDIVLRSVPNLSLIEAGGEHRENKAAPASAGGGGRRRGSVTGNEFISKRKSTMIDGRDTMVSGTLPPGKLESQLRIVALRAADDNKSGKKNRFCQKLKYRRPHSVKNALFLSHHTGDEAMSGHMSNIVTSAMQQNLINASDQQAIEKSKPTMIPKRKSSFTSVANAVRMSSKLLDGPLSQSKFSMKTLSSLGRVLENEPESPKRLREPGQVILKNPFGSFSPTFNQLLQTSTLSSMAIDLDSLKRPTRGVQMNTQNLGQSPSKDGLSRETIMPSADETNKEEAPLSRSPKPTADASQYPTLLNIDAIKGNNYDSVVVEGMTPRASIRKPKIGINCRERYSFLDQGASGNFYCGCILPDKATEENSVMPANTNRGSFSSPRIGRIQTCASDYGQCADCIRLQSRIETREIGWGPATLTDEQRERAKAGWNKVRSVFRKKIRFMNAFQLSTSSDESESLLTTSMSTQMKRHSIADMMRAQILDDDESSAEIYQTVLNSANARVRQMFDTDTISVTCFKLFLECLEHGEEAIAGELRPYGFLKRDSSKIYKCNHRTQMEQCLNVVWESLKEHLKGSPSFGIRVVEKIIPNQSMNSSLALHVTWKRLQRDVELVLTYVMIHEAQLDEISLYSDFPKMRRSVTSLISKSKSECLYAIQMKNPILFALIEHILAIRMVILIKRKVLEDFAALGVVKSEDFDSICHCVIEPALKTLEKFVPTMDFLPYNSRTRLTNEHPRDQ